MVFIAYLTKSEYYGIVKKIKKNKCMNKELKQLLRVIKQYSEK